MPKKSKKTIKNVKNINIAKCFKGDINDFNEFAAFFTKKYTRFFNENTDNKKKIKNDKKPSTTQNLHLNKRPSVWDFYFDNHNSRDKNVLKDMQNFKEVEIISPIVINNINHEENQKNLLNLNLDKNNFDGNLKNQFLNKSSAGQNKLYDVLLKTKENCSSKSFRKSNISCNTFYEKKSSLDYLVELSYQDYLKIQNNSKKLVLKLIEKESKSSDFVSSLKNNSMRYNFEDTDYDQFYDKDFVIERKTY